MLKRKLLIILTIITFTSLNLLSKDSHFSGLELNSSYSKESNNFNFGFGLNYEYFFPKSKPDIGVGLITQANIINQVELIAAPAFYIHPVYKLTFFLAPGILYFDQEGVIDEIANTDPPTYIDEPGAKIRSIVRFGAKYDFLVNRLFISPVLSFDLIGNNYRIQLGANVGLKF